MYDLYMNKELYRKQLQIIFDLIEYWYLRGGENSIFYIHQKGELGLELEDACVILKLIEEKFFEYIKIIHIYDFVNEEHWLPIPLQEYPTPRPIAEIEIRKSFREFSDAFKSYNTGDVIPGLIANKKSNYNLETSTLTIGGQDIELPFDSRESKLVEILFHYEVGTFVDWSVIDEIVKGNDSFTKDDKRWVRDAARRVNNKVKKIFLTTEEFISRESNGVCRNL